MLCSKAQLFGLDAYLSKLHMQILCVYRLVNNLVTTIFPMILKKKETPELIIALFWFTHLIKLFQSYRGDECTYPCCPWVLPRPGVSLVSL